MSVTSVVEKAVKANDNLSTEMNKILAVITNSFRSNIKNKSLLHKIGCLEPIEPGLITYYEADILFDHSVWFVMSEDGKTIIKHINKDRIVVEPFEISYKSLMFDKILTRDNIEQAKELKEELASGMIKEQERILLRMLDKVPVKRYQSISKELFSSILDKIDIVKNNILLNIEMENLPQECIKEERISEHTCMIIPKTAIWVPVYYEPEIVSGAPDYDSCMKVKYTCYQFIGMLMDTTEIVFLRVI